MKRWSSFEPERNGTKAVVDNPIECREDRASAMTYDTQDGAKREVKVDAISGNKREADSSRRGGGCTPQLRPAHRYRIQCVAGGTTRSAMGLTCTIS